MASDSISQFDRTKILIGDTALDRLKNAKIILFGLGGVGGYVAESLIRTGIGHIDLVDKDVVDITNLNRQIIATNNTIGKNKTEVMRDRLLSINKDCDINIVNLFYTNNDDNVIDFKKYDYVIDCIDNITGKISIIEESKKANVKVISSMGSGNRINTSNFKVADISVTKVCPLAKVMRHELKKRNIDNVKVVYSDEVPAEHKIENTGDVIGSFCAVVGVCGFTIAQEVIKDILHI